jgi:hypothetical protein
MFRKANISAWPPTRRSENGPALQHFPQLHVLCFADTVNGGITTLSGWSLGIAALPETVGPALAVFAGLTALGAGLIRCRNNLKKATLWGDYLDDKQSGWDALLRARRCLASQVCLTTPMKTHFSQK